MIQQELSEELESLVVRHEQPVGEVFYPYCNGYESYQSTVYYNPESTFIAPPEPSMLLSGSGDFGSASHFLPGYVSTLNEVKQEQSHFVNGFKEERDLFRLESFDWAKDTEESQSFQTRTTEPDDKDAKTTASQSLDGIDLTRFRAMMTRKRKISTSSTVPGPSESISSDDQTFEEEFACGICFNCDAEQHKMSHLC